MKPTNLIIALALSTILLLAGTAFATEFGSEQESEFERGFSAGRKSCDPAKEAWICTLPMVGMYSEGSYTGPTRGAALLSAPQLHLRLLRQARKAVHCEQI